MEVQFGPNSLDEPNLLYKLQRKIKVFNTNDTLPNRGYNFVASASKYGIIFVASPDGILSAYYLGQLIDKECEAQHVSVRLLEKPSHIAVSCDQELLAVTGGQLLCIYRITDFQNQNVSPAVSIKCDVNPGTFVSAVQWNPCVPDTIAMAFYDGTLLVSQVTTGQVNKVQSKARCICWSPKGKQLVTGNSDGTLCQYKPNLAPAKMMPAPNLFEGAPVEALAIYWISTFQFAVVYKNATDNSRPAVTVVNTPKAGQPSCLNYEDICYSMGSNRPWYYYLQGLPQWNIILCSSSNSMEIGTLGSADGASWLQWCQTDEARPELPLTDKKIENYPVGICIDTCAIHQLPWGENEVLPYMPLLLVVSQTGLLTLFNIINLNKQAAQLCSPPQQLALPAPMLTTTIPGEVAAPTQQPVSTQQPAAPTVQPVAPTPQSVVPTPQAVAPSPQAVTPVAKPQPVQPIPTAFQPTSTVSASAFGALSSSATKSLFQPQVAQEVSSGFVQATEQKSAPVMTQPQASVQVKPAPVETPKPQQTAQAQEVSAALKAEQEKANKLKANQELKNMLIREVNEFQMELYKFMLKTRETQAKLQRDIDSINTNFSLQSMDAEQLKKDCSLEDLRTAIVQLKLELVRACAVVAEARTHAESKDLQWTQADPLTTKRVASVKKLAYYVQNQVDQAQKALDYKWNEALTRDIRKQNPGKRMIRPVLDDIYQPLVKQQEILSRQQAVLKTLRNTLKECEVSPMFKSTSLLRSTPFRNKDPLSKLTKNILNMSIETQPNKEKETLLSAQKLDALRDMLSNHKTIKIKPVNVEMRQRLATMKINYDMNMREKAAAEASAIAERAAAAEVAAIAQRAAVAEAATIAERAAAVKAAAITKKAAAAKAAAIAERAVAAEVAAIAERSVASEVAAAVAKACVQPKKIEVKPEPKIEPSSLVPTPDKQTANIQVKQDLKQPPINIPSFTPVTNLKPAPALSNVARTLFTDEPPKVPLQPQIAVTQVQSQPSFTSKQAFTFTAPNVSATNTRSVLKDLLQNKQANSDVKNDANMFMGQKICSPTAFAAPIAVSTTPSNIFSSKPISDITNMFSKFQPQAFAPEPKPQVFTSDPKPQTFVPEPKLNQNKNQTQAVKPKTSETGEPEVSELSKPEIKKEEKTITNLFAMKTSSPIPSKTQNIPDIINLKPQEKPQTKPEEKEVEISKENVSVKTVESAPKPTTMSQKDTTENKNDTVVKSSAIQAENKAADSLQPISSSSTTSVAAPEATETQKIIQETKTENKPEKDKAPESDSTETSSASLLTGANESTPVASKTESSTLIEAATSNVSPTCSDNTQSSASSIFGKAVAAQSSAFSPKSTQSGSIFATSAASPTSGVFGTSPVSALFGTATTTSSVFGATTQSLFSSSEQKPSVFSTPALASPASVFGGKTAQTTQAQSVFGSSSVFATTTSPSIFGSPTTGSVFSATTTQSPLFGGTSTTPSVFGTASSTTQPSVFGGTTTTPSVFGASTTSQSLFSNTASTTTSVFGAATVTTQSSVFGATATTQASVFGGTTPSVFGAPSTQPSVFGASTPTTQSVFGSSTQTTQASVFGSPTQTTQASVFGTTATTTQSGSLFGGAESNLFAAASISTTSAPSPTSGGSIFGGGSSGSVFGGGNSNVFGSKPAFSQPNSSAASIFGGGTFGQKPTANFWSGGNTTTGGGFGSGFGQQATTQASSIFGGTTGGSFSTPNTGQPFGSSQQGSPFGGGENKPSVFGSPQQQTAPAFGGSPVFGNKPVFGQSSAFSSPTSGGFGSFGGFNKSPTSGFGAPATFGGGATFGTSAFGGSSPNKVFGGSSPSFGSPTQSNATFESLATQNTLTFGNLAQQSGQPPPQQQPTFNTSPSFTGWRG